MAASPTSRPGTERVEDLVMMGELTEDSMLTTLDERFSEDKIYTWVGRTLIAINPYKNLGLYGPAKVAEFMGLASASGETLPPHVYSIAHHAYDDMMQCGRNQAICNSGESSR